MTRREHKYLKADKWMYFLGGEPFKVPARYYFMQRRISLMTTAQYIRWKQQQCVQQDLNDKCNPAAGIIWMKPTGNGIDGSLRHWGIMMPGNVFLAPNKQDPPPVEYYHPRVSCMMMPSGATTHSDGSFVKPNDAFLGNPGTPPIIKSPDFGNVLGVPFEYMQEMQNSISDSYNRWTDLLRNEKQNPAPNDERSVATDLQ